VKFFLDNMISPKFAKALTALDKEVTCLRYYFPENTPDEIWVRELGHNHWPLVTVDKHVRTRPLERHALKQANVTTFFLCPFFAKLYFWPQAVWLVKYWPRFEDVAKNMTRGICFSVQQSGKMTPLPPV
jgi:hypothetical protein